MTEPGFQHEAVVYRGAAGFLDATLGFVREGLAADEPVLVAVLKDKVAALSDELGADAARVTFLDMAEVGRNPARIIPAWQHFLDTQASDGRRVRGIGEPVWAGRTEDEVAECHIHEALLNTAFDQGPAWRLRCPYDAGALPAETVAAAVRTHPLTVDVDAPGHSRSVHRDFAAGVFDGELADAPADAITVEFGLEELPTVRDTIAEVARHAGMPHDRVLDVVLAVHELASNSVRHAGGRGVVRAWRDAPTLLVEVCDEGRIFDPLVGRIAPGRESEGGRGVWLANQVCDLVQIRSSRPGTQVRLHVRS